MAAPMHTTTTTTAFHNEYTPLMGNSSVRKQTQHQQHPHSNPPFVYTNHAMSTSNHNNESNQQQSMLNQHHHHHQSANMDVPSSPSSSQHRQQQLQQHSTTNQHYHNQSVNGSDVASSPSSSQQQQQLLQPPPVAIPRPKPMQVRSVSAHSFASTRDLASSASSSNIVGIHTKINPTTNQTTTPTAASAVPPPAVVCATCGVNAHAVTGQMALARRKLELLQEKVQVDQDLLDLEQKNFKRRLHTVRVSVKKTQRDAAARERQRQLDWSVLQSQTEAATLERIQTMERKCANDVAELRQDFAQKEMEYKNSMETMQEQILYKQTEWEGATALCQEQQVLIESLRQEQAVMAAKAKEQTEDATNATSAHHQQDRIERLERALEHKSMALEGLEMQLLELERDRDATGLLRGSGGTTSAAADAMTASVSSNAANTTSSSNSSGTVTILNRQLSDAQLQVDTLLHRQIVNDEKLSQERRKYEELRSKMDQLELAAAADQEQNNNRLRLTKDLKDTTNQLAEAKQREQMNLQRCKEMEKKVVELQLLNGGIEEKLECLQKSHVCLQDELKVEQENAVVVQAMAAATQRAAEDSAATPVIDVLSGRPTDSTPTAIGVAVESMSSVSAALVLDDTINRKHVMEFEWLGPVWSGVYTGQLSTVTNNPDGDGTLRVDDGAVYNGEWRNGKPHGSGVWATIEGDLYCSSSWHDGEKHGRTVDVLCDGCVYRGDYLHGQRHGHGVLTWPYGAHYSGQFSNDKRNGQGVYCYADGRCYTGMYLDDRPHGYGIMKTADGVVVYDGMWQLGEFLGKIDR